MNLKVQLKAIVAVFCIAWFIPNSGTAQSGVGIDVVNPQEMLDINGAIKIGTDFNNSTVAPTGGAGTIRWNGTNFQGWDGTQWVNFSGSGFSNTLEDADGDTKIQVEESPDEDKIRFDLGGTEYFRMEQGRIIVSNFNNSIAIGGGTLPVSSGGLNIAIGNVALNDNTTGYDNIAIGQFALEKNTTGEYNVSIGTYSMNVATNGSNNVAIGKNSGYGFTGGSNNTFVGMSSGASSSGAGNTSIGQDAGRGVTGSNGVFIGKSAGVNVSQDNRLYIENSASSSPLIYGEFDTDIVGINGNLGVGTSTPAARLHTSSSTMNEAGGIQLTQGPSTSLIYQNTNSDLVIRKFSRPDQLVLDANGNVGIGTNAPTEALHVVGGSISSSDNYYIGNTSGTGTTPFRIDGFENKLYLIAENGTNGSATGTEIRFRTASTNSTAVDVMTISNNGNLGIGTQSPETKLDVFNGDLQVGRTGNTSGSFIAIRGGKNGGGVPYNGAPANALGRLEFRNTDHGSSAVEYTAAAITSENRPGTEDGDLRFYTTSDQVTTEAMNINYQGNVGIGTIADEKLHVIGSIKMVDGNQQAGYVPVSDANGKMTWSDPATVVGSQAWSLTGNAGTNPSNNFIGTTDSKNLRFLTNNTERMVLTNAGRLGIGTTNPSSTMHVAGITTIGDPTSVSATFLNLVRSGSTGRIYLGSGGSAPHMVINAQTTNGAIILTTSSGEVMRVRDGGNVGIGTASPADRLHVTGNIRMVDGNQQAGYIPVSDANGKMTWTDPATISTASDPDWTISGSDQYSAVTGNVGIGTNSPSSKLQVAGNAIIGGTNGQTNSGARALVVGNFNTNTGDDGLVVGYSNNVTAIRSLVVGLGHQVAGDFSVVLNNSNSNTAAATTSIVGGFQSSVTASLGLAIGWGNTSSALAAAAFGRGTKALSFGEFVVGTFPTSYTPQSISSFNSADRVFVVGNGTGTGSFSSNALTVFKNGTVNINDAYNLPTTDGTADYVMRTDGSGNVSWADPNTLIGDDGDWTMSGNDLYSSVSGKVGIGTASPTEKLDVRGNAYFEGGLTTKLTIGGARNGGNVPYNTNTGNGHALIDFQNRDVLNSNTNYVSARIESVNRPGSDDGDLRFYTTSDLVLTEAMNIRNNGNVGIGTIGEEKLHVAGNIRMVDGNQTAGYIPVSDANGKMTWTDPTTISTAADGDGDSSNELQTLSQSGTDVTLSNGGGTISVADNDNDASNEIQTLSISGNDISLTNSGGTVTIPVQNSISDADNDTKIQVEETADEDIIRFDLAGTEKWVMTASRLEPTNSGNSVFIGNEAGRDDDLSANVNVFIGNNAGRENINGFNNVAIGASALRSNNSNYNIAIGNALMNSTSAQGTIVLGHSSMPNSNGLYNVAIGTLAGTNHTSGTQNVFIGSINVAQANVSGSNNIMMGAGSGQQNTGSQNVFLGVGTGSNNTGSGSVFLGHNAGKNEASSNRLYIENSISASPLIYGEFDNDILGINGNLGVGTQAPQDELHVVGSIRMVDGNQTVGYIPVSDANGTMSWTDPTTIATADDGDWSISGNDIYNSNSGNVGIGTTAPNATLQVQISQTSGLSLPILVRNPSAVNSAGAGSGVGFSNHNAGTSAKAAIYNERVSNYGLGKLHFLMNNTADNTQVSLATDARMTILSNGNIGIGETSPLSKLHVVGNIRMVDGNQQVGYIPVSDANGKMMWTDPTTITTSADGDGDSSNELQILSQSGTDVTLSNGGGTISVADNDNDATNEIQTLSISGSDISLSNSGGTVTIPVQNSISDADNDTKIQVEETADEDIIHFDVAGVEYFRMLNGRLEVLNTGNSVFFGPGAGSNTIQANTRNTFLGSQAGSSNSSGLANVYIGHEAGRYNETGNNNIFIGASSGVNSLGSQNIAIGKQALYSNTTGGGNVAIGYQAGTQNVTGTDNVFIGSGAGYYETGSNLLYIENSSSSTPLIYGEFDNNIVGIGGNLGVGTQAPSARLHVQGAIRMVDGNEGVGKILTSDANGTMSWVNPTSITTAADGDGDATNEIQDLSISGNILSLSGDASTVDLSIFNNPGTDNQNLTGATLTGTSLQIDIEDGSSATVDLSSLVDDSDWTASGNNQYSAVSGNVGIGTPAPVHKLQVVGGSISSDDNYFIGNSAGTGTTPFRIDGYANKLYLIAENGADGSTGGTEIRFRTASANTTAVDVMTINNNGNVGIGVTTPTAKLDVKGTSHTGISVDAGNNSVSYIDFKENGTIRANVFWNGSSDVFGINNLGTTTALNPGSGNVGIGTYSPSYKLDVNGEGRFSGTLYIDNNTSILPTVGGNFARIGWSGNAFQDITTRYSYVSTAFSPSDSTLKKDIMPVEQRIDAIQALKNIQPKAFKWNLDKLYWEGAEAVTAADTAWRYGFIAQDIEQVMPETVHQLEETGTLAINFDAIVSVLFEATRKQQEIIEQQAAQLEQVLQRLHELETR